MPACADHKLVRQGSNAEHVHHITRAGAVISCRNIIGCCLSIEAEDYSPSEQNPAGGYTVTRIHFEDNVFSQRLFGCVGYWGVWFSRGRPTDGWRRSGNYVLETGQKIDSRNPSYDGHSCT